jgi:hypothetical protein
MPQINTYSDISSFVNTVWEDAFFVARENNVMAALVTGFTGEGMAVRTNSTYSSVTVNAVGESDDLTSQAFYPTSGQTLTPAEFGAQFFFTDTRLESDIFGVRSDAAIELGRGFGQAVDNALLGDLDNLTGGTVGTAGSNITWANIFAAQSVLRAAFAPTPYVAVLSPYQWHCLGTAVAPGVTVTNAPALQDAIMERWFVGNVAGVDIYLDGNIAEGTSIYGAMFARPAMALDWRRAPRLEPERDASRRGWELNMSMIYAHGVWRPAWGVAINTAGTAPV